jgi:hypothetical protein
MYKNKILLLFIVVLMVSGVFALAASQHWLSNRTNANDLPDGREELRKIYAAYFNKDSSFNISGKIRLYDQERNGVFKEETGFHYVKKDGTYYYELGYLQTAFNGKIFVQMDSIARSITVSKIPDSVLLKTAQSGFPLESFLTDTSAFKTNIALSEKDKERTLLITTDNPDIKSFSITYDPLSYKIKQVQIEWWKKELPADENQADKMVWLTKMEYRYASANSFSVEGFINKILTIKEGEVVPADLYKDYQIQTTF